MRPDDSALPGYAVVSPVRDEAASLPRTIESVVAQTHPPLEWVIVDDGSTDDTRAIAETYAERHPWIRVIAAEDGGAAVPASRRARGAPVVRAFETGRRALTADAEVIVKLDGDLFVPPHYFEWVARTFARQPRAGIVGGVILEYDGSIWRPAHFDPRHVRGALKAYRRECLEDIGGLRSSMGWDGIDEYGGRARGWGVHVLTELPVLHYRPRGSRQPWMRSRFEEGRACHFMGYRTSFVLVRTPRRALLDRPPLLGAMAVVAGFGWSHLRRSPTIDDPEARRALREEQGRRLRGMLRGSRDLPPPPLDDGGPAFWTATGMRDE